MTIFVAQLRDTRVSSYERDKRLTSWVVSVGMLKEGSKRDVC